MNYFRGDFRWFEPTKTTFSPLSRNRRVYCTHVIRPKMFYIDFPSKKIWTNFSITLNIRELWPSKDSEATYLHSKGISGKFGSELFCRKFYVKHFWSDDMCAINASISRKKRKRNFWGLKPPKIPPKIISPWRSEVHTGFFLIRRPQPTFSSKKILEQIFSLSPRIFNLYFPDYLPILSKMKRRRRIMNIRQSSI